MELKVIIDGMFKKKNWSLSWLAAEMGKTFDGLKLSLIKGSIKYADIKRMAEVLHVSPAVFIDETPSLNHLKEDESHYGIKNELESCRELAEALRSQLRDKEHIISLLSKEK